MMEEGAQRIVEMRLSGIGRNTPIIRLSGAIRQRTERGELVKVRDPASLIEAYEPASDMLEVIDRICQHLRRKEPGGHRFVPLIGHRDFALGGAEDAAMFDHALGQAQSLGYIERQAPNEAAYRLTPTGFRHLRELGASAKVIRSLFLSHAALNRDLAILVRDQLKDSRPDLSVFVASRPGDIRADEDWLPVIQREIRGADAYCVLLTPNSSGRPWVWFETGAAWMSGKSHEIPHHGHII
jgi:TIR domain-containing protein